MLFVEHRAFSGRADGAPVSIRRLQAIIAG
jgi:hypothetical protein